MTPGGDKIAGVPPGVQIRKPDTEKWLTKRRASLEVDQATYEAWEASLRAKITDGYGDATAGRAMSPANGFARRS